MIIYDNPYITNYDDTSPLLPHESTAKEIKRNEEHHLK